ncbi:hypothetical protein ACUX0Y_24795 [Salmonella enterica]|uniref:hypothetical protein n=1 Tax=Salmonella sp. L-S2618 TaxID=2933315 RepID=UPI001FF685F3|nr:hypothetical protein [Salmonella sp. L-S2618]MCK0370872.1 hypothetical protein [Salmonella sp. L-S2618]
MTEQKLGHCQQLADLTPLIAKLGFWSDIDLPCWAGFGALLQIVGGDKLIIPFC